MITKGQIKKVTIGLIPGVAASTNFKKTDKPFTTSVALLCNVTAVTQKTYYNLMYGLDDNAVKFLAGYFFPKEWDLYVVYSKQLSNPSKYLRLGIEKKLSAGSIDTFIFFEGGPNFNKTNTVALGILISAQKIIWRK